MKIWKIILGFLSMVGALFAVGASKSKEVKSLVRSLKKTKKKRRRLKNKLKN